MVCKVDEGSGSKSKDRYMIADEKVFLQLPLKTEVKVEISGLYITAIKSVPRGGLIPLPKKKTIGQRIKGIFKKD